MSSGKAADPPEIKTAVLLAGGEGLRLRPLTDHRPKSMITLAGKPIIEWIIEWLLRQGIHQIVVGVAYKKEMVIDFLQHLSLPVELRFSEHTISGGTGEGFRLAIERHVRDQTFLAMNGDEITNLSISQFAKVHVESGGVATIAISQLKSPFGVVKTDGHTIVDFKEKSFLDAYVSTGIYIFDRRIVSFLPKRGNVEDETFPKLAQARQLKAFKYAGFWGTVNTLKDLHEVEREVMAGVLLNEQ